MNNQAALLSIAFDLLRIFRNSDINPTPDDVEFFVKNFCAWDYPGASESGKKLLNKFDRHGATLVTWDNGVTLNPGIVHVTGDRSQCVLLCPFRVKERVWTGSNLVERIQ